VVVPISFCAAELAAVSFLISNPVNLLDVT